MMDLRYGKHSYGQGHLPTPVAEKLKNLIFGQKQYFAPYGDSGRFDVTGWSFRFVYGVSWFFQRTGFQGTGNPSVFIDGHPSLIFIDGPSMITIDGPSMNMVPFLWALLWAPWGRAL